MPKTQKVRALFLISNRWNSAISEYALSAAESLRRKGFHTGFVSLEQSPVAKRAARKGHEIFSVKDFSPLRLFAVAQIIRKFAPHAVFTFGGPETFLASNLRSFASWSLFRFRGNDSDMKGNQSGIFFRASHRNVDAVIVPNSILQQKYQAVLDQPVHMIPLGMDETRFIPREPAQNARRDLIIVGRLDPVKGHREFLTVFKLAKHLNPTLRLDIIGEPANITADEILAAAKARDLVEGEDFSLCAKRVENLPERMAASIAGVISSLDSEVICRVGVEFLLTGAPIFVSGAGALEDLLFPGAGESYRDLNTQQAAEKLDAFARKAASESFEERKTRAAKAREEFSLEKMGQRLAHLFISDRM